MYGEEPGVVVLPSDQLHLMADAAVQDRKLKVLVAGAHPDDPESGCGGVMALFAAQGHEVVSLYLTRGEAGIPGKGFSEVASIRTGEAEAACKILGARAVFAGQVDGATELDAERYDEVWRIFAAEKPDIVFAHWPIDTHRDHRVASLLAYDAWLRSEPKFALYYYEVLTGDQTQHFRPTHYADIGAVEPRKRQANLCHQSQHAQEGFYPCHQRMHERRGKEAKVPLAEAFSRHEETPARAT